jgi:hypothetical protein
MTRQYRCKHFKIKELVHPSFIGSYSESILWEFLDEELKRGIDMIREYFGKPVIINSGDTYMYSGLRNLDDENYPKMDPHKLGRAMDLHLQWITGTIDERIKAYDKVREDLMLKYYLNSINFEMGVYWLHVDTYNREEQTFQTKGDPCYGTKAKKKK